MIREITDPQAWNNFLLNLNPNTFLQSWEWGQVQKASGTAPHYLGIFENDIQVGGALVLAVPARRGPHFLIPHGPVFKGEEDTRKYLPEIINHIKSHPHYFSPSREGESKRGWAVALRIAPLLLHTPENISAFQNLGFRSAPMHVHAELTWMLDINQPDESLLSGMRKTTRHAIRRAQAAGVTIEITTHGNVLNRFLPLYEQTKHRHDFVPYSPKTLQTQLEIFGKGSRIFAAFARHNNQDIAAGIFFHFGNTVFYYHGASDPAAPSRSLGGVGQLLQWEAIHEAQRRAAAHFNFWGISPEDEPKHPFAGITVFKKGFGGRALNYMHAQDLPLSVGYWKLWLIDTYRRLRRGF